MNRALIQSYSKCIHTYLGTMVLFPEEMEKGKQYPLLVLLHDHGHGRSQWLDNILLAEIVEKNQIIVALPQGNQSCFVDYQNGQTWGAYLNQELLTNLEEWFPVQKGKQHKGVLGIGTGGYGALLAAEGFSCRGAVDPVEDLADLYHTDFVPLPEMAFGLVESLGQNGYILPTDGVKIYKSMGRLQECLQKAVNDIIGEVVENDSDAV